MTLGGATMIWNGVEQDYNFLETLECLYDLCDEVSVLCGGTDGTEEIVADWVIDKRELSNYKQIHFLVIDQKKWDSKQGREKLSYFSNAAIAVLETDYTLYVQSDEVIHESCAPYIRQAVEEGAESYMITRHNLWATPFTMLNVGQNRKPVSTEVIRLAKSKYRCVDDAESLGVPEVSFKFLKDIRIYHMGFVRDKYKHLTKIRHMQEKVFLWDVDKRIHDNTDGFSPWKWGFTPKDIVFIEEKLPKYIQQWAKERWSGKAFEENDVELAKEYLLHIGYNQSCDDHMFNPVLVANLFFQMNATRFLLM